MFAFGPFLLIKIVLFCLILSLGYMHITFWTETGAYYALSLYGNSLGTE